MKISVKGDKNPYEVRDRHCIGRPCLNLHPTQVRGATPSGSRFVGWRYGCARRDYYGCPTPTPNPEPKLAAQRRRDGLRNLTPR